MHCSDVRNTLGTPWHC